MSKDCWVWKYGHHKNLRKQRESLMEIGMMWCCVYQQKKIKEENAEKKVQFTEDVKQPSETCMMCAIDFDTFFVHDEYLHWRLRCMLITNDNTGLYDITNCSN